MSIIKLVSVCVICSLLSACVTTKKPVVANAGLEQKMRLSDVEAGRQYLLGRGVVKNETKAFSHLKHAADSGDALSQNEVAYLYASGKGVTQDYGKALQYYQLAADQGLASAQYNVGIFYLHGLGTTVNQETAKLWVGKAATHGFEPAVGLLRQLNADQGSHAN